MNEKRHPFYFYIFLIALLLKQITVDAQNNIIDSRDQFEPNVVIIKLKKSEDKNALFGNSILLNNFISENNVTVKALYPSKKITDPITKKIIDLSNIYKLEFPKNINVIKIANYLKAIKEVSYAEPFIIPQLCYTPSDTSIGKQFQLSVIKAFEAWDIEKGDSNVVIGITDTGIDIDHPDLVDNIAYNYADPIDGIDNDNDGYVDNYRGWDTGDNDNDPSTFNSNHGNNVSGLASASTDNITGIAGTGFKCKFLPIKIDRDVNSSLTGAYDGIVYAADQGVDIINCSWGSFSYSNLANDIINYATAKGSLVVAAAGNNGEDIKFYPSAYENSLSVAMTNANDSIRSNSNYGRYVDVMAIGDGMYTTSNNAGYNYNGGTSMASPLVAGAAGIVKSKYPSYTPLQIAERVRNTADNIDATNPSRFSEKMGNGRINMYRSVTDVDLPGVRTKLISINDGNDSTFVIGDTLRLIFSFTNYLKAASSLNINLSSPNNSLAILNPNLTLTGLNTFETKDNSNQAFLAVIKNNAQTNERAEFKVTISEGNYVRKSWFETSINVDYINISNQTITTTLTSNGRLGYNDFSSSEGVGFIYKNNESALYEGSFVLALNNQEVFDGFRGETAPADADFESVVSVKLDGPKKAPIETQGIFKVKSKPDIEIQHQSYTYQSAGKNQFIILSYKISSKQAISNAYAGLIIDWDILDYSKNKTRYEASKNLAYSYSTEPNSSYYGMKLLSNGSAISHGIDNVNNPPSGINLNDGFNSSEKYDALSIHSPDAGNTESNGNDILQSISFGPFSLAKDSSITISFAILVGDSLNQLDSVAAVAQLIYNQDSLYQFNVEKVVNIYTFDSRVYPNPSKSDITLALTLENNSEVEIDVYDVLGKKHFSFLQNGFKGANLFSIPTSNLRQGVYFLKIKADGKDKLHKIVLSN